jgi:outer membrane protein
MEHKMKRIIIFSISLSLLLFVNHIFSARIKIAKICYVNTQELLKVHPSSRNIISKIQNIRNKYKNEIQNLEKEIKELENKVKNQGPNMSQSDLRTLLTQIEAKKESLNDGIAKRNSEIRKLQKKELEPVYKQILEDIRKYASSLGYNIVLDSRYVLIGAPDLDITEDLKRIFMKK